MYSCKCVVVVILCNFMDIRTENWYYADRPEEFGNKNHKIGKEYQTSDGQGFLPLVSIDRLGTYKSNGRVENLQIISVEPFELSRRNVANLTKVQSRTPDIFRSSDFHVIGDYYKPNRNSTSKPIEVINYNNTINVVNVVKRIKSKKKMIKRICLSRPVRKNKKLAANQTASAKFLKVFEVIEFENIACTSSSGLEGICLHEYECQSSGGSTMGTCADGYGTCCVTQFLCDGQSSDQIGWFSNPGFPSPSSERLSCTFTLNKASEDVKQIRLDFVTFELLAPTGGTCQLDQFVVSGQNMNSLIPILCGINTGQHAYIEVGEIEGPIYMSVQTVSPENRLFSIKVTQLTSADDLAAPSGCLQYFAEQQGFLESFNYRERSEIGIPRVPSYFNNLNYAMCIRRAPETCSVTYTNADTMQIVNYDLDGLPVIPYGQAGVEIFNCPGDWLLISATRLCGDRLNDGAVLQDFSLDAPVTDTNAGPIAVWFRTDEGYVGRGFKIQYQQNACNGPP